MAVAKRSGPDWTDLEMMMRALEGVHACDVVLTFSPAGIGSTGGATLTALAHFDAVPGGSLIEPMKVEGHWPEMYGRTIEGLAFDLLWKLDWKISEAWKTKSLAEG